jgi:cobalt-zinc-cadmium efflux system membrane fusion protein
MNRTVRFVEVSVFLAVSLLMAGCSSKTVAAGDTAPPAAPQVEPDMDASNFKVDHPEQFPVVTAGSHASASELTATANTSADTSRQRPVISTATGRVIEIDARVGDEVRENQLLFKVKSSDIAGAFSNYRHAVQTEELMKKQLVRAQVLIKDGAIPVSQLEVAQTAEDGAQVDVQTTLSNLQTLGVADPANYSDIVEVRAPASGVITDQEIANGAAVQAFAPANAVTGLYPFTISDVSKIWIICDVYENNLAQVHMDEYADVRLNAYPDRVFKGRISNIGQILDPNLHTAKVRIELDNPGVIRLGMFATATFRSDQMSMHATVPDTAILRLHDRDWVYTPAADNHFKRLEVTEGASLPNGMREVISGIKPGDKVVSNALVLQSTVEQ